MSTRTTTAVALGALAILTLTACAGGPAVNEPSTPKASVTREQAEERTGDVQRKIIDAFPSGAVADDSTSGWTLLACTDSEVQSSTGAKLTLARDVDVDDTYAAITEVVEGDGYTTQTGTTPKGAKRLTVTGSDDDQYLVTIYNDTKNVRISSFSQCFPGALTDD